MGGEGSDGRRVPASERGRATLKGGAKKVRLAG
jgi:hypothetical protein